MKLEEAVPWGRSASEYINMFALTPRDRNKRILDCGGGPSSFNSELTKQNNNVVSCDPLYQFSVEEIRQRIGETYPKMTALNEANKANFRWEEYGSPPQLGQIRMRAMGLFLEDYMEGKEQGRYVLGQLPALPFPSSMFDLALCSHLLFTYSDQYSTEFHIESMLELIRVATETRVFPLLTAFTGDISPHLPVVMDRVRREGHSVEIREVAYEFQKGGNKMLRVVRSPEG